MLGGIQSHFLIFIVHPEPDGFINNDDQNIGDDERVGSCGPNTHQLNPNLMEIADQQPRSPMVTNNPVARAPQAPLRHGFQKHRASHRSQP